MQKSSEAQNYYPSARLHALVIPAFLILLLFCPAGLLARPVNKQQAKKAVRGWLKLDHSPLKTQLGNQVRQVDAFGDDSGEAIYYVVCLEPSGFVIVPADDLVEPIIAFADDGIFDPSDDNPLGALVSGDLPGRVAAARTLRAAAGGSQQKKGLTGQQLALEKACFKAQGKWAELQDYSDMVGTLGIGSISDVWVAPLVQSEWGQNWVCSGWDCYNYYTPNNWLCGCVATAMAQLMRFHEYPGTYVWSNMPLRPWDICGTITLAQRQAIGDLCFDAAESVETTYGPGGSSAYIWKVRDALPNIFSYSNAIDGWNNNIDLSGPGLNGMVNPNLDAGFPALLGIRGAGGHAVVTDGYGYNSLTLYHHLNMGWDGIDDAWYNLPTVEAYYDYDAVEECIYNIFTSGSGEIISGRVTDTLNNPISGATVTGARSGGGTYNDTTDGNGIYALAKIPSSSTYTVSVTKSGYIFTNQVVATGTSTHDQGTSGNKWGIDFVGTTVPGDFEPDCDVDFYDFAVLASAWRSSPGDGNWNPAYDISDPNDNVVDERDLDVFTENWLTGVE